MPYLKFLKMKITFGGRGTLKTEIKMNHTRKKRENFQEAGVHTQGICQLSYILNRPIY